MPHLVAIDASAVIHRAWHGARRSTPDNQPVDIRAAVQMALSRILSGLGAIDFVLACADSPDGSSWRKEIDPAYKATRRDRDLLALVSSQARICLLRPSGTELLDETGAAEVFGIPPDRIGDFLALRGDPSDNVPGVHGIGEKAAGDLVRRCPTAMHAVLAASADELGRPGRLILADLRGLWRSRQLVALRDDAPVGRAGAAARWTPEKRSRLFSDIQPPAAA